MNDERKNLTSIETTEKHTRARQLSIGGCLLILTSVAAVLALARFIDNWLTTAIICSLPLSWVIEYVFRRDEASDLLPANLRMRRFGMLCLYAAIPATVCWLRLSGDKIGLGWLIPYFPYLCFLAYGVTNLVASQAIGDFQTIFEINPIAAPALVFLFLCFPIIHNRSCSRLPIRSAVVLLIFAVISAYWFSMYLDSIALGPMNDYIRISAVANAFTILGLFATWLWQRSKFTNRKVVLWNLVMTVWLFGFALPAHLK